MNDQQRNELYDLQLRTAGHVTTTLAQAERYIEARTPRIQRDPERPGLVRITPPAAQREP